MEKTKNLGIRATPERWKEIGKLAKDREVSVQRLVDEAIDTIYFSSHGEHLVPANEGSPELSEIISSGLPKRSDLASRIRLTPKQKKVVNTLIEILNDCPENHVAFRDFVTRQLLKISDEKESSGT